MAQVWSKATPYTFVTLPTKCLAYGAPIRVKSKMKHYLDFKFKELLLCMMHQANLKFGTWVSTADH